MYESKRGRNINCSPRMIFSNILTPNQA